MAAPPSHLKLLDRDIYGFPSNRSICDVDGHVLNLLQLDDKLVSPFGEQSFRKVRDVAMRADDVLLCGYPKTGCHWTWEILRMMVTKNATTSKMGKTLTFLEIISMHLVEEVESPRVLNTHLWYNYLPAQVSCATGFDLHRFVAIQEITLTVDYGSYFDYYFDWDHVIKTNPDHPILLVSYEDMKEDLPREIRKMASFLELSFDDKLINDIAEAAGFEAMKQSYSQSNTFSSALLRKGQVGDWKNCLTVAQSEAVDEKMNKLDGTRFTTQRYEL
ncbi:sulfotransferase 6B1-like [Physella acuta]|uniref:sulfotransferase 6B1-like n=1 Tax=Physella acuta TaxID=109671 RepID=UPI0027DC5BAA|nr:sulfotransferase 6B1-like [Physella acuta]